MVSYIYILKFIVLLKNLVESLKRKKNENKLYIIINIIKL